MSQNLFADVRRFALLGGSPHFKTKPEETLQLCYNLVNEEVVKEFLPALMKYSQSRSIEHLTEAVDGAIDGIYVLVFFLNQMGVNGQTVWNLVQDANMAKFPDGVAVRDKNGKVVKPAGWTAPDADIFKELVEWNTWMRGEDYKGGLIQHRENPEVTEVKDSDPSGTQPD